MAIIIPGRGVHCPCQAIVSFESFNWWPFRCTNLCKTPKIHQTVLKERSNCSYVVVGNPLQYNSRDFTALWKSRIPSGTTPVKKILVLRTNLSQFIRPGSCKPWEVAGDQRGLVKAFVKTFALYSAFQKQLQSCSGLPLPMAHDQSPLKFRKCR